MRKTLFYIFIVLLIALLIYRIASAEDRQLRSGFWEQDISATGDFKPIATKDNHAGVSIHHTVSTIRSGNYLLSLDLGRLKREAGMEVIFNNAYENPTSPNVIAVFQLVLHEFTYFKGLKRFLDSVETEVEMYRRKYKLKGEVGFTKQHHIETSNSANPYPENIFSNLFPKRISWHFSSDLSSNYLKGEVNIGNYFVIEGNWGNESDIKLMLTFPL
jgi:hypothetical protein